MFRWQIHVTPAAHADVEVAAKRLGISSGEFVRRAIDHELDRGVKAEAPAAPGAGVIRSSAGPAATPKGA
jgi:hypothetical protein